MTVPLYISESQVKSLFTMDVALEALDEAFIARSRGNAFNEPRRRLPTSSGAYNFMAATWPWPRDCGAEIVCRRSRRHRVSRAALRHVKQLIGCGHRSQRDGTDPDWRRRRE